MKKRVAAAWMGVAIAMTATACTPRKEAATLPQGTLEAWTQAFNSGNQEALLATYTADAVLMPPNAESVTGHEGAVAIFGGGLKQGLKATQTTDTLEVRGDIAFRAGKFTLTDSAGTELDRGKYIELWRKQPDGSWKMSHDMWSSSKPAPAE